MSDWSGLSIVGVIAGLILVIIPDPATTATGAAIVAVSVGAEGATGADSN